jgi:DNA end-binding protein Ku
MAGGKGAVMARPVWTGAITFGLVSVPVSMYSATHEHEVSFHQFAKGTSDRIRYRRVNERTGKEVEYDDIVKGADIGDGDYVMLEQEELDSVAPGRSRSMEIDRFVELGEIDPIYYQKTYYLGPGGEDTAKVYALLRDAMADADKAAIGTLVMRGKEYLAGIRP